MTQTTYQPLSLGGFAPKKARLVRKMEADGWTGRISTNGHAIMRAPDGETTSSVSPKMGSPRGMINDEAPYKRWKRDQGQSHAAQDRIRAEADRQAALAQMFGVRRPAAPVDTAPESAIAATATPEPLRADVTPEPEPEPVPVPVPQICGDCQRPFATLQALSVHKVRAHVRVTCQFCDHSTAPGNMPRHERKHDTELADPKMLLREVYRLRREAAEARAEATEWERLADESEDRLNAVQIRMRAAAAALAER